MTTLAAELFALEQRLQTGAARKSAAQVEALLTDDFPARSAALAGVYDRPAILAALRDEVPVAITMTDFAVVPLAEGVALVTYRLPVRCAAALSLRQWSRCAAQCGCCQGLAGG